MAVNLSTKRILIDRANSTLVVVASVAAFVFVFSLVATKTLISQSNYQSRVIGAKRDTLKRLKADISAGNQLETSYKAFTSTPLNIIGGTPNGSGAQDGDNTKIVLDALPSSYDFPAFILSVQQLLKSQNVTIGSISGTDDEVAQSANQASATPQAVAIPFQISVTGDYNAVKGIINELEHSIRPIQVKSVQISGNQDKLSLSMTLESYYQPAKSLNITSKVVE